MFGDKFKVIERNENWAVGVLNIAQINSGEKRRWIERILEGEQSIQHLFNQFVGKWLLSVGWESLRSEEARSQQGQKFGAGKLKQIK